MKIFSKIFWLFGHMCYLKLDRLISIYILYVLWTFVFFSGQLPSSIGGVYMFSVCLHNQLKLALLPCQNTELYYLTHVAT